MGSLMAGWSAASRDMNSEKLRRNKSQIKEEIETYWKTKKRTDEIHDAQDENQNIHGGSESVMQRSVSLPLGDRAEKYNITTDEHVKSNCWWTRSNWAFLNEPPVKAMEGPAYKYAAQYHVAQMLAE